MTASPSHAPVPDDTLPHAHHAGLGACLDLVNTVELTDGVPHDHIPTTEDVIHFLVERGLAHEDELRAQAKADPAAWLDGVRRARSALREVWDAAVEGRSPAADAVESLNEALAHAPRTELRRSVAGVVVGHRHDPADPTGEAIARLTEPLLHALEAGETARFRVCANDGCRWVFEDTSRGGRRRWCDMSSCGNRAKVRRFRSKRRDGEARDVQDAQDAGGATAPPDGS
jgi:predicted RNA-binding Zn ribbon-like protein